MLFAFDFGDSRHFFVFEFEQRQVTFFDNGFVLNLHKIGYLGVGFVVFIFPHLQSFKCSL